jgi:hypothetical protein
MADDIYSPNLTGSRRFQTYMNQYGATSGRVPSAAMLDQIIQSELDAASNNMYREKSFQEGQRQFNVSQQNAQDTAAANQKAGIVGTGMQALTSAALLRAMTMKPGAKFFGGSSVPTATKLITTGASTTPNLIGPTTAITDATLTTGAELGASQVPTIAGETTLGAIDATGAAAITPATGEGGTLLVPSLVEGTGAEVGVTATPWAAYAAPASAGYIAPKLLNALHKDSTENLGHMVGIGKIIGGEHEANAAGSAMSGAAAGALTGAAIGAYGGPIGAGVGAVIGGVAGLLSSWF